MQRFDFASGVFFTLLALVQLMRLVLRWPVTVAGAEVPLWVSGVACLIAGGFAVWAFRTGSRHTLRV